MRPRALAILCPVLLFAGSALAVDIPNSILSRLTNEQRRDLQNSVNQTQQQQRQEAARKRAEEKRRRAEIKKAMKENLGLIKELFKKAEEAFKEESYATARNYYEDVASATVKGAEKMVQSSKSRLMEIEKIGEQRLQAAELMLLKTEYAAAAEELAAIVATFPFTDVSKKAEGKLRILKNTPRAAAAVLYADALGELNAENYPGAVSKLKEVISQYPGQVAAMKAEKRLAEAEKDPAVQEALKVDKELMAEKLCPKWMNMANNYLLNGQKGRAKEYLLRITSEFAGTSYASEAEKKLKDI